MPRKRYITPGFFTNEVLADYAPLSRLLWAGLWTIADRDGILEDRPRQIKVKILPYDDCEVDEMLDELDGKFILRYRADDLNLIYIPNFKKFQNPHPSEKSMGYPHPSAEQLLLIKKNCEQCSYLLSFPSFLDSNLEGGADADAPTAGPVGPWEKEAGKIRAEKDAKKEEAWEKWKDGLVDRSNMDGTPTGLVGRFLSDFERGIVDYYERGGGSFTLTRRAWLAARMGKHEYDRQLYAIEIYCDNYSGDKDERYAVGIARRMSRMSEKEVDREMARHRKRNPGGICGSE